MAYSLAASDQVWVLTNYQKSAVSSLCDPRVHAKLSPHMPPDFFITRGIKGKPQAQSSQSACPHFSVAHSGDLLVLAISKDTIGIDIELIKNRKQAHTITNRYFSSAEPHNNLSDFYHSWTAREAFVKALGHGFSAFSQVQVQVQENLWNMAYQKRFDHKVEFKTWDALYVIAVCRPIARKLPLYYLTEHL